MRVLVVHNLYQHLGGEDLVMQAETALLRANGHEVRSFIRDNDQVATMGRAGLAARTIWSASTVREVRRELAQWRPDVVHVHNTLALISPSVYWACAAARVPVVQTIHNFRLLCPQAIFLRNERVCEDCLGRLPWRAALHGCYRGSRSQSAVLASMLVAHRALGTWRNKVTRYIALNEFCRRKLVEGGLPPTRIAIKPNFVDVPALPPQPRSGFLYVGRLAPEKGIGVLAQASVALPTAPIRVAGDGPSAELLAQASSALVRLGSMPGEQVLAKMAGALALLLPSICYESFPRTLVEAYACGLPVIASRLGALADLVEHGVTGLLFEPGNANDLAAQMRWAMEHPDAMLQMGRNARARYEAEFTAERNYQQLMAIYRDAIAEGGGT